MPICPCGQRFEPVTKMGRPRKFCYRCKPLRQMFGGKPTQNLNQPPASGLIKNPATYKDPLPDALVCICGRDYLTVPLGAPCTCAVLKGSR